MKTNVIVTFKTKADKTDEFKQILGSLKSDMPQVDGCNGIRVFSDSKNPNTFTVVESWDSEGQHQKHIQGVIESGMMEAFAAHLESEPVSSYYAEI